MLTRQRLKSRFQGPSNSSKASRFRRCRRALIFLPQLFDLLLHLFALPLFFAARWLVFEFGELDAVILAAAAPGEGLRSSRRISLEAPDLERGFAPRSCVPVQAALVGLRRSTGFAPAAGPRAGVAETDGFGRRMPPCEGKGRRFLDSGCGEDVPSRGFGPLDAKLKLLAALLDRAGSRSCRDSSNCRSRARKFRRRSFAFGQLRPCSRWSRRVRECRSTSCRAICLLQDRWEPSIHFGVSRRFHAATRLSMRLGQPGDGRVVLAPRRPATRPPRRARLLLVLCAALFRGRQLDAVLGQIASVACRWAVEWPSSSSCRWAIIDCISCTPAFHLRQPVRRAKPLTVR